MPRPRPSVIDPVADSIAAALAPLLVPSFKDGSWATAANIYARSPSEAEELTWRTINFLRGEKKLDVNATLAANSVNDLGHLLPWEQDITVVLTNRSKVGIRREMRQDQRT